MKKFAKSILIILPPDRIRKYANEYAEIYNDVKEARKVFEEKFSTKIIGAKIIMEFGI